ncbi:SH2 domain-containing protein 2A isoform X2 [Pyxicephalus adspersus]|uniref:SH2 domain-containing protein 2A isoform X2 n=1 Tax=Pyxicephalus adspersus TaxID=30357 RepID=UPI003B5B63B5
MAHPNDGAMAYGCQEYQQDFPPVLFSTFKPLPPNKEEQPSLSTNAPTLQHKEELKTEDHEDKERPESSKITPNKDIMVKPGVKLKEKTYQWFERTQRKNLVKKGQFPEWFHGFVTRKGVERCRHFVLNQRDDGQYVIEGETSVHPQLEDLINYYYTKPVEPYKELLTIPCPTNPKKPDSPSVSRISPNSPTGGPMYGRITKPSQEKLDAVPVLATSPKDPTKQFFNGNFQAQLQSTLLGRKVPASSEQDLHSSQEDSKDPIVDYAPFSKPSGSPEGGKNEEDTARGPTYASVDELHTYSEPALWSKSSGSNSDNGLDPIAFYAIGRGSCRGDQDNVYSEVDVKSMTSCGPKASKVIQLGFSTLPPSTKKTLQAQKPTALHSSFRHVSGIPQEHNPIMPVKPAKLKIPAQFDDIAYSKNNFHHITSSHPSPVLEEENIYEKIPEEYSVNVKKDRPIKKAS